MRGGGGTRLRPLLQPGNTVRVVWRARLDEHLGNYVVEPLHLHGASQLAAAHVVYGVTHLARCAGCCRSAIRTRRCTIISPPCWSISTIR